MNTSVADLVHNRLLNADKKVRLFNPGTEDFTVMFQGKDYTLHAQEIETFSFFVAEHIKKHLVKKLVVERYGHQHTEAELERVNNQIEVKL